MAYPGECTATALPCASQVMWRTSPNWPPQKVASRLIKSFRLKINSAYDTLSREAGREWALYSYKWALPIIVIRNAVWSNNKISETVLRLFCDCLEQNDKTAHEKTAELKWCSRIKFIRQNTLNPINIPSFIDKKLVILYNLQHKQNREGRNGFLLGNCSIGRGRMNIERKVDLWTTLIGC